MKFVQLEIFVAYYILLDVAVFAKIVYNTHAVAYSKSTVYVPRVIDKTCLLKPDVGPCRSEIPMFHYNASLRDCEVFSWGGCQGNGNRFDTRSECLESCWSKPNELEVRPKFCKLSFDYGFCFGDIKRWYYDHVWKMCKETIYSGCGGNKNNFYGLEQCETVCLFGNLRSLDAFTKPKSKTRKVVIINAEGATSKRGRHQVTSPTKENDSISIE